MVAAETSLSRWDQVGNKETVFLFNLRYVEIGSKCFMSLQLHLKLFSVERLRRASSTSLLVDEAFEYCNL